VIHHGDCLDVMAGMDPEAVDAIVTDPPYNLVSIGQRFGKAGAAPVKDDNFGGRYGRLARGFMGKTWDGDGVAFRPETWAAALRVAKPSAYLLAFGGTRTVHRLTCAIEDAGWIIRDMLVWAYASGFPKSKASLKPAWEPIVMARKPGPLRMLAIDACRIPTEGESLDGGRISATGGAFDRPYHHDPNARAAIIERGAAKVAVAEALGRWPSNLILTDPIFDGGWEGVVGGTQRGILTACPMCGAPPAATSSTAGGPIGGSIALWSAPPPQSEPSTSARSAAVGPRRAASGTAPSDAPTWVDGREAFTASADTPIARPESPPALSESGSVTASGLWPASMSRLDSPVRSADPHAPSIATTTTTNGPWTCEHSVPDATTASIPASTGGYSRFFLLSKADRADREPVLGGLPERVISVWGGEEDDLTPSHSSTKPRRNSHPTVKPVDLMRHLVRLVTPTGGTVLDPFLGSGSTAIAAEMEGFAWIGIEKEAEYVAIAEARLNGTQRGLGLPA